MSVLLDPRPDSPREQPPTRPVPPVEGDGGSGGGRQPDQLAVWFAVTVVVLLAVGLTYVGMLTQIWANLSGAQLPGA
jgi:hypothetical protein